MTKKTENKRLIIVFPIMIAMYPILHLWDVNADQALFSDIWPPLVESVIAVCVLWFVIWLMRREPRRAGITVSILAGLYYYYFTYSGWIAQLVVVLLVVNWLIYFIYKSKSDFRAFVVALNVGSIVMVGAAVYGIASQVLNPPKVDSKVELEPLTPEQEALVGTTPNVYFILMDGYGGQDALELLYRNTNSKFLQFLDERGFWVGRHSRTNYMRTLFSLPSLLNMMYFDDFVESNELLEETDTRPALELMKASKVRLFLQQFGYTSVGISSGFTGWDMFGAEDYIDFKGVGASEFRSILNEQTPLFPIAVELAVMDPFQRHRELQIEVIEYIPEIPKRHPDTPIVSFIHIMCPHPPFVFLRDGSPAPQASPLFNLGDGDYIVGQIMDPVQYQTAYSEQLAYLNTLMTDVITKLQENDPGAIIVMQGDHGPGSGYHATNPYATNFLERSSILNSVYLPNQDYEDFYPKITPVNTFRIIFNRYFGTDYELLPDKTYYSVAQRPYDFGLVTFETDGAVPEGNNVADVSATVSESESN